ncbi:uncharacterized protein LOC125224769 isoform X2 [Leguminivora glycinivorella]|uniref:uncharacterized protein LOC125224769 isoform X1 n=1 Tax=Leguminivora glycinivorella TaxID=1035111 RepID=UPI00200DA386|nr:uncharacterized protein LOC125224769 isoform X1 [Leguminivora glycinivorella]XP_047984177.1 uncharacterized protein LOC125224769 isoform X2 [Leguminivora glycinivorella]
MKSLLLLTFVAACQGLALQKAKTLPRPNLLLLTALDPLSLEVEWEPVKQDDPSEPILGYKVLVWQLQPVKKYKYEIINGVKTLVQEMVPPTIGDADTPLEKDAMEIVVQGPQGSKTRVPSIKLNVIYEVRVRAFSARRDGPLSSHMRVQIMDDKKSENDIGNEAYHFV